LESTIRIPNIGWRTLSFDLVDTWNNKVIGGCTYFVNHPGGRSFDTYPVNSFEAESRKMSRFGILVTPSTSIGEK
jgi:uncharacterized protein (DUF2126 family)